MTEPNQDARLAQLEETLRTVVTLARECLDNAHWEVRYGSGSLNDALNEACRVLSLSSSPKQASAETAEERADKMITEVAAKRGITPAQLLQEMITKASTRVPASAEPTDTARDIYGIDTKHLKKWLRQRIEDEAEFIRCNPHATLFDCYSSFCALAAMSAVTGEEKKP